MARGSLFHLRKLFSYTPKLLIRVRDLFIRVCEPCIRTRDQDIIGFSSAPRKLVRLAPELRDTEAIFQYVRGVWCCRGEFVCLASAWNGA
jgi:hypothetical protein